jgi:hypothetical protein
MKKVILLFVFVAVYGVTMAMSGSNSVLVSNMQTTIVANMMDNDVTAPETEKEKEKAKGTETKTAKSEGCGGEKSAAKSEGCGTAKSEGCGDKTKSASAEKK